MGAAATQQQPSKVKRWANKNLKINADAANKTQGQNEQLVRTAPEPED